MSKSVAALFCAAVVFFAFACEEDIASKPPAKGAACTSDSECPPDYTCHLSSGLCVPKNSSGDGDDGNDCTHHTDCDPGMICVNGNCEYSHPVDGDGMEPDGDGVEEADKDQDKPDGDEVEDEQAGQPCMTNADCNDGYYCNGTERCGDDLFCEPGQSPCDDEVDCTDDTCDEPTDTCSYAPNNANCSDREPCNGEEICDTEQGCLPGEAPDCSDELDCTNDSCVQGSGCLNEAIDALCDDGVACTTDRCMPGLGGCSNEPDDAACDDGVDCTDDTCDEIEGCGNVAVDANCDDGLVCTLDVCNPDSGCEAAPNNSLCNDYIPCTVDTCDTDSGDPETGCLFVPDNGYCDDGLACTSDTCTQQFDCTYEAHDGLCDDSVDCTVDRCQVGIGCAHEPDHVFCADQSTPENPKICDPTLGCVSPPECLADDDCNDNNICTGVETCISEICHPGMSLNCHDDIDCTTDACDPSSGCLYVPDDSACEEGEICDPALGCRERPECESDNDCDDSNVCNGLEFCGAGTCRPGEALDCGDGVACTVDDCDPADGCSNTPDDEACPGDEICDPLTGCREAIECYTDADCSDNNICNGIETCDADGMCVEGSPTYCEDGLSGNHDNVSCDGVSCNYGCDSNYYDCNGDLGNPAGSGCELLVRNIPFGQNNPATGNTCSEGMNLLNGYPCGSYGSQQGLDVVYKWTATASDDLLFGVRSPDESFDPDLYVLMDPCDPDSVVGCMDAIGEDVGYMAVTQGETYYIVVDTLDPSYCGNYEVGIEWYDSSECESTGRSHHATFVLMMLVLFGWVFWMRRNRPGRRA